MTEKRLRQLVEQVRCGSMSRRHFIDRMLGLGLSAPMAGLMLMERGVAQTPAVSYKPTQRGGGGVLKCWDGWTDAAQPPLRDRPQRQLWLTHLLRTIGAVGC